MPMSDLPPLPVAKAPEPRSCGKSGLDPLESKTQWTCSHHFRKMSLFHKQGTEPKDLAIDSCFKEDKHLEYFYCVQNQISQCRTDSTHSFNGFEGSSRWHQVFKTHPQEKTWGMAPQ